MFILILTPFLLLLLTVFIDFVKFSIKRKRFLNPILTRIIEVVVAVGFPILYLLLLDFEMENDCCTDSATFSPDHRLSVYFWIVISTIAYLVSIFRDDILPPIIEVIINSILLLGLILNGFIAFQVQHPLWVMGNLPIGLLYLINIAENQLRIIDATNTDRFDKGQTLTSIAWEILNLNALIKYPVLLVLGVPIVLLASSVLMLFGQKPDALIQAFTQTYKHGFSELDHLCQNVECGGHYLCSVAANGHKHIVKPKRYGIRNGNLILCNRQLLASNAFEDLIIEISPRLHRRIRSSYNKVGQKIHKYYYLFENKLISDLIYLMMKPLEWIFIIVLYTFDRKPENRIARQYLKLEDQLQLKTIAFKKR